MAKRNYPNDNYVWYNDDNRVAILERATSSSSDTTTEKYDTIQSSGDLSGTITGVTRSTTTATYTCSAAHSLTTDDRVSISGTTDYNDADLASQAVTVTSTTIFTMTLSEASGSTESGLSASFTSLFINDGLRLTYHSKYESVSAVTDDLKTSVGLDSGMHHFLIYYVKYRLYEDMGDLQSASYFKKMFDIMVTRYPSRKSGVRALAVPRI